MEIEMNRNRIYIVGAIAVGTLILLWMVFRPDAVRVETAGVARTELLDTIDAEGRTSVKNKFTVTAPVSGKLKRIALREGDNILRNYPITEVDPNPPIPRAPSNTSEFPNPYAAKVFAPASGRVLRIFEKSERFLEVGTPLLEIGDPSNIEVVVDVLSTDAVRIRPGSRVLIENIDSGEPIRAQVRTIEPQALTKVSALGVEEKRVDIVADFIDKKPTFGDNFRLDVRIVVWQGDNVISVPNSALFRSGEDWNVFVVEGGRAYLRKVETGHRSRTDTQITAGLSEGETVILHPPNVLSDGARVSVE
jgi:multidrug efflux pump subunit AcrA (membrane-fusion protein)